jgi:iron complex transport system substrate-binding protein
MRGRRILSLVTVIVAIAVFAAVAANRAVAGAEAPALRSANEVAPKPARIISLVPAATEMLFALGAGPRVVAVSSYDHDPPQVEHLPRVGALLDPDLERIFALHPDLVAVYGTQADLIQQLTRAHIGVFPFVHGGLADVLTTIDRLGARVGEQARAKALVAQLKQHLDAIRQHVAGEPRPRTLLIFERQPFTLTGLLASGGVGFLSDMLDAAGGENVFANVRRQSLPVSTETIIAQRPDVILELHYGEALSPADLARDRASWNVLGSVPAVHNHRIYILTGDDLVSPGPRIAEATERISRALHPDEWQKKRN